MRHSDTKKHAVPYPYIIAAFVLLMCLAVWPLRLFGHTTYENTSLDRGLSPDLLLSDDSLVIGEFTPEKEKLESISFKFLTSGKAPDGQITLEIYDSFGDEIQSVTLKSGDAMNYRWTVFPLDLTLDPEQTYTYRLFAFDYDDASLSLYVGADTTAPAESGRFFYNGSSPGNISSAITYTYTGKVDAEHYLPYYAAILIFGLILYAACRKSEPQED